MALALALYLGGMSKVCPPKPLEAWPAVRAEFTETSIALMPRAEDACA